MAIGPYAASPSTHVPRAGSSHLDHHQPPPQQMEWEWGYALGVVTSGRCPFHPQVSAKCSPSTSESLKMGNAIPREPPMDVGEYVSVGKGKEERDGGLPRLACEGVEYIEKKVHSAEKLVKPKKKEGGPKPQQKQTSILHHMKTQSTKPADVPREVFPIRLNHDPKKPPTCVPAISDMGQDIHIQAPMSISQVQLSFQQSPAEMHLKVMQYGMREELGERKVYLDLWGYATGTPPAQMEYEVMSRGLALRAHQQLSPCATWDDIGTLFGSLDITLDGKSQVAPVYLRHIVLIEGQGIALHSTKSLTIHPCQLQDCDFYTWKELCEKDPWNEKGGDAFPPPKGKGPILPAEAQGKGEGVALEKPSPPF